MVWLLFFLVSWKLCDTNCSILIVKILWSSSAVVAFSGFQMLFFEVLFFLLKEHHYKVVFLNRRRMEMKDGKILGSVWLSYSNNFLISGVDMLDFCYNKDTLKFYLLPSSGLFLNLLDSTMQQTYLIPQGDFIEVTGCYRIAAACYCQNRTFWCLACLYLEPGKSDVFQKFLNSCNKC